MGLYSLSVSSPVRDGPFWVSAGYTFWQESNCSLQLSSARVVSIPFACFTAGSDEPPLSSRLEIRLHDNRLA
jgi:hypothetical protein